MVFLLGIDVGTSSVKTAVIDAESGRVLAEAGREYPISQPIPGYAEQNPEDWWQATVHTVREVVREADIDSRVIGAIGLSGQMHGGVCLDKSARPLRPAIIWADSRSRAQVETITRQTTLAEMAQHAPGMPATGFLAPTLMWLAEHEPDTLAQIHTILLPKDYVRLKLTGELCTDISDAAATWLMDIESGDWSDWLIDLCGLERRYLPEIRGSLDIIAGLTRSAASELHLTPGIKVVAGSADQPAQSMGYGVYNPGKALVTIATGGQVIHSSIHAQTDPQMRVYVFNHAVPERWYAHAAILSAGLSLRWLRDLLGMRNVLDAYQHLSQMAAEVPAGAEGLLFLPYLAGNRTPHMDSSASGVFVGLRLHHGAKHMARAVMEGVAFAMHDCLELIAGLNGNIWPQVIASGGATRSPVWRQIQADVYDVPLTLAPDANYACIGAALLAGVGTKVYASLDDACARAPKFTTTVTPNANNAALYQSRREVYRTLYDDLKEHMHTLVDNP